MSSPPMAMLLPILGLLRPKYKPKPTLPLVYHPSYYCPSATVNFERKRNQIISNNTNTKEKNWDMAEEESVSIDSSNIGFKLLKKHGWKEGTGLGVSEQGRLEPLQAHFKNNKRGLGAPTLRKKLSFKKKDEHEEQKPKPLSKKQKKLQEMEKRLQEKDFERAFFRDFWPDNV